MTRLSRISVQNDRKPHNFGAPTKGRPHEEAKALGIIG
jgi:hypothetical protein